MRRKTLRRCGHRARRPRLLTENLEPRVVLAAQIVLTEFMAVNDGAYLDEDGQASDWIEVANLGDAPGSLQGWTLNDTGSVWTFPDVTLDAGQHLVVFASGKNRIDPVRELHTNFSLRRSGEYLALRKVAGAGVANEFNPYPEQSAGVSYGFPQLANAMQGLGTPTFFASPTPGALNPSYPQVYITEFMSINQGSFTDEEGDFADWIEIHNAGTGEAFLGGWALRDDNNTWEFPAVILQPGEYRVIFATGNDRRDPDRPLHTNFRLGVYDELSLLRPDESRASDFEEVQQFEDISYGWSVDLLEQQYFVVPTPGGPNQSEPTHIRFSHPAGIQTSPISLRLVADAPDSTIRYTLDGTEPNESSPAYTIPIHVATTTVVRAANFRPGHAPVHTGHTYVFPAAVASQSNNGLPDTWGVGADYAVTGLADPLAVLSTIPTVSLAMDLDDWFSAADGIYSHPLLSGNIWTRSAIFERDLTFAASAGAPSTSAVGRVSIVGTDRTRNPLTTPKFSLDFSFDNPLTGSEVVAPFFGGYEGEISGVTLRSLDVDSWLDTDGARRIHALYGRDAAVRYAHASMGHAVLKSELVHVYLNGLYWGIYQLEEQPTGLWSASHFGGTANDYDLIVGADNGAPTPLSGNMTRWNQLWTSVNSDVSTPASFSAVEALLDMNSLIDYILLKRFAGVIDTENQSWFASANRTSAGKFGFYFRNADNSLGLEAELTNDEQSAGTPEQIVRLLMANSDFQRRLLDRAESLAGDSQFEYDLTTSLWRSLSQGNSALIAEAARWSDYRQLVHPFESGPYQAYSQNDVTTEANRVGNNYIPNRRQSFMNELREAGWAPSAIAPIFSNVDEAAITSPFFLGLTVPEGQIYYTLDGTDPAAGDEVSDTGLLYSSPIRINQDTRVNARTLSGGVWSGLRSKVYHFQGTKSLLITELMYHPEPPPAGSPYDDDDFEFVELQNVSTVTQSLQGVRLENGIEFDFSTGDVVSLEPGERVLVVKNREAFASRYDTFGLRIAGEYAGQLNNGGDVVFLTDRFGFAIQNLEFQDVWYPVTDGGGYSLVRQGNALQEHLWDIFFTDWKASHLIGGSPGQAEGTLVPGAIRVNEVLAISSSPTGDWIERKNTTTDSIDIGGWFLSDSGSDLRKYRIPEGTIVAPGGFIVFTQSQHFENVLDPGVRVPFALGRGGETVYLSSGDSNGRLGGYRTSESFASTAIDVSLGIYVRSDGKTDFVPLNQTTFGAENAAPIVGPVVINEIMYRDPSDAGDYVELHNFSSAPVRLGDPAVANATWELRGGIDYTFPDDATIPANGYVIVVESDPAVFRSRRGLGPEVQIFGPYEGLLRGEGETISLYRPDITAGVVTDKILVEQVAYNDRKPWPMLANGFGGSVERRDGQLYGNDVANWMASRDGGTPAQANVGVNNAPRSIPYFQNFEVASLFELSGWNLMSGQSRWELIAAPAGDNITKVLRSVAGGNYECDGYNCSSYDHLANEAVFALNVNGFENLVMDILLHATSGGSSQYSIAVSTDQKNWRTVLSERAFSNLGQPTQLTLDLTSPLTASDMVGDRLYVRIAHNPVSGGSLDIAQVSVRYADAFGPWIRSIADAGAVSAGVRALEVTMTEPVDVSSFNNSVQIIGPLGESLSVLEVLVDDPADPAVVRLTYTESLAKGRYNVVLGSNIRDLSGNRLSPVRLLVNGNPVSETEYRGTFDVGLAVPQAFPYVQTFDSGTFQALSQWSFSTNGRNTWRLIADGNGDYSLRAFSPVSAEQAATFALNLADTSFDSLSLDFSMRSFGLGVSSGTVSISVDNEAWHTLDSFLPPSKTDVQYHVDLNNALTERELPLDGLLFVRISHYGVTNSGIDFDNVRVSSSDVSGPTVIASSAGDMQTPVDQLVFQFDEPLDPTSVTPEAFKIVSPVGSIIPISSVTTSDNQIWTVRFVPSQIGGAYRWEVRPSLRDHAGNYLNADQDGFNGESSARGSVEVRPSAIPMAPYLQIFDSRDLATLPGWSFQVVPGAQWRIDRISGDVGADMSLIVGSDLGRWRGTASAMFAVDISTIGANTPVYLNFDITSGMLFPGTVYFSSDGATWRWLGVEFGPHQVGEPRTYSFALREAMRQHGMSSATTLHFRFEASNAAADDALALDNVEVGVAQRSGPRVLHQTQLLTDAQGPYIAVDFDQAIQPATFTAADVVLRQHSIELQPESVVASSDRSFKLRFPASQLGGIFQLGIGPNILGTNGVTMNQNGNALSGEPGADMFFGHLEVAVKHVAVPYRQTFDAGEMLDLAGWTMTVEESYASHEGTWGFSSESVQNPSQRRLEARKHIDCWATFEATLHLDLTSVSAARDLMLDFSAARYNQNSRYSLQLFVGRRGGERVPLGESFTTSFGSASRFEYDLDAALLEAGIPFDNQVQVYFVIEDYWYNGLTTLDDIGIYRASDRSVPHLMQFDLLEMREVATRKVVTGVRIEFDEPVVGLDLNDIYLLYNGRTVNWTNRNRPMSTDGIVWEIPNLDMLVRTAGTYQFTLRNTNLGISDAARNLLTLATPTSHTWVDTRLEGDVDFNRQIDSVDYQRVISNLFSTNARWVDGDVNGDQKVDAADFNLVNSLRWTAAPRSVSTRAPRMAMAESWSTAMGPRELSAGAFPACPVEVLGGLDGSYLAVDPGHSERFVPVNDSDARSLLEKSLRRSVRRHDAFFARLGSTESRRTGTLD